MKFYRLVFVFLSLIGIIYVAVEAGEFWKARRLVRGAKVIRGEVISEQVVESGSSRIGKRSAANRNSKVTLEIALDCCGAKTVEVLEALESWNVAKNGSVELLWDGNCPPHVVFKGHPYTGSPNAIFGLTLILAGLFGFAVSGRRHS